MVVPVDGNRDVSASGEGVSAVVVAGGSGVRMKGPTRKQYLLLDGRPILSRTLEVFNECARIDSVFLVVPEDDFGYVQQNVLSGCRKNKEIVLVPGGKQRQHSVFNGVCATPSRHRFVVVHDGVRPLIVSADIERVLDGAGKTGACILGLAARETLKRVGQDRVVRETPSRENIWFAQTPQAFDRKLLLKAHETAVADGFLGTDDASLVERLGEKVLVVEGSSSNIKITTPEDLVLAKCILKERESRL